MTEYVSFETYARWKARYEKRTAALHKARRAGTDKNLRRAHKRYLKVLLSRPLFSYHG